ncbi:MAG TPA: hypothetical protein VD837_17670 [Terriglobales bacterium]|nr:hypothetical protein [Terriglobales bacterium]
MASKRRAIKRDDLTKALKELEELLTVPPEPKLVVTAGEAVRELAPIFRKLRRKGHSTANISKTLEKVGIAIGPSTLNSYLRNSVSAKVRKLAHKASPASGDMSKEPEEEQSNKLSANRPSATSEASEEATPTKPVGPAVEPKKKS